MDWRGEYLAHDAQLVRVLVDTHVVPPYLYRAYGATDRSCIGTLWVEARHAAVEHHSRIIYGAFGGNRTHSSALQVRRSAG